MAHTKDFTIHDVLRFDIEHPTLMNDIRMWRWKLRRYDLIGRHDIQTVGEWREHYIRLTQGKLRAYEFSIRVSKEWFPVVPAMTYEPNDERRRTFNIAGRLPKKGTRGMYAKIECGAIEATMTFWGRAERTWQEWRADVIMECLSKNAVHLGRLKFEDADIIVGDEDREKLKSFLMKTLEKCKATDTLA